MHHRLATLAAASLLALLPAAHAATGLVTFDPPGTDQGPSIFVAVPAMQTITAPEATFSGGVALGFATFFPAIAFATAPNVYGTANFGNGLSTSLTIDVAPSFQATQVGFALFNGETFTQSYRVDAYNGANLVATQTVADILPNWNSGFALVDIGSAAGITKVNITPINAPGAWDFLIDTVVFNQTVQQAYPQIPPPPIYTPQSPPPVTMTPVTVTYTDPDTTDGHGHKQKGKTHTLENQFINYGDDNNNAKGHFEDVMSPVPEAPTPLLLVAGLGLMGLKLRRRVR